MIAIRGDAERISFEVRVIPRSSRAAVGGAREGALLVRVTAAPADGAANDAVVATLARALDVARGELRIERGASARTKTISAPARAAARLRAVAAGPAAIR